MQIGTNIKVLRTARQIKQKELAEKLGITVPYLSMIENNSKRPSLTLLEKLAKALNAPLALLFSDLPFATS